MNIEIKEYVDELFIDTSKMLTELMNYHRKLTNAPKEYWQTDEESMETIKEWCAEGKIYHVFYEDKLCGFFYLRFGGQDVAWLEDLFIKEAFRSMGVGRAAFKKLDELMESMGIVSMFVNVIPRNTSAIKFYQDCGFDHLNMIELRKNYKKSLDKNEEIEILGFRFKKY